MIDFTIEDKGGRFDNVRLTNDQEYTAQFLVEYHDISALNVRAEILPEPKELSDGGDYEKRPRTIDGLIVSVSQTGIVFNAPSISGPYRIFVYVADGYHNVATANIPFYVP